MPICSFDSHVSMPITADPVRDTVLYMLLSAFDEVRKNSNAIAVPRYVLYGVFCWKRVDPPSQESEVKDGGGSVSRYALGKIVVYYSLYGKVK